MKSRCVSVVMSGAVVLGIALGCAVQTNAATQEGADGQARVAETTLKLENEFSKQFVAGQIDRTALAPLINDVVRALPNAARPKFRKHIDEVLATGEKLAVQMTPDERTDAAAAHPESIGKTEQALVNAWGWPIGGGWGGLGAFGFPGAFYGGCTPAYGGVSPWGYSFSQSCASGSSTGWYW
jgi:hypothetical protein